MRTVILFIFAVAASQSAFAFTPAEKLLAPNPVVVSDSFAFTTSGTKQRHGDFGRRRHRGIRHAYASAGRSVGHGSRHFAGHMRHGRPLHAGASFGRGMGGFGKHFGKGTARVGKRIVNH